MLRSATAALWPRRARAGERKEGDVQGRWEGEEGGGGGIRETGDVIFISLRISLSPGREVVDETGLQMAIFAGNLTPVAWDVRRTSVVEKGRHRSTVRNFYGNRRQRQRAAGVWGSRGGDKP